ncbi:MAG: RagB/SusD family nutrient uptake outer membrane protein [Gemmatimonadetes bacterium]|nr:RagB/SusD family nutrient uptake outer membrane protein [Gemmatimonadota bacterium]
MRTRHTTALRRMTVAALVSAATLVSGCKEITVPNYNSPNVDGLLNNPDAGTVNTAVIGLLVGARGGVGTFSQTLGIFGREMYNLDQAEPRNFLSFLVEPLTPGGFGTDLGWTNTYRQVLQAETILGAVEKVGNYTAAQKEGVRGFTKTFEALALMEQLRVRDTFGIVLEVDPTATKLGDFVTKDAGYTRAAALLDEARTHLNAAGTSFAFALTSGFTGFNTPVTFLRVNRALKARLEIDRGRWQDALTALSESFIAATPATAATLATGVYHTFSTASGDATNPMFDASPRALVAHPSFLADAQRRADNTPDLRTAKVAISTITLTSQGVSSNQRLNLVASNAASYPLIRNEELLLMRAEANANLGNRAAAIGDLNVVRTVAGGLAPLDANFAGNLIDELLYNRRYSLFGEYGNRWVDMRRYGRLAQLPKFAPTHRIYPIVPLPADECNQRSPQPKGCTQVSGI